MPVKTKVIKIGNSKGVRIPKALLEQANLGDEVEMEVQEGKLIMRNVKKPREGWEEDFARMAEEDKEILDITSLSNEWDDTDWEW
ncbi:MAG: AbrB/MazE/SpoVT family DNA-binding domain-containing protein [Chloroflexi bacterium]|nr:AbrB/MazE/SpoVT family DNA-binding domain-containing protein [Chloroflexota bacterium]